ncbi:MAG: hypothetical protein LBM78_02680 [Clostridiales bacterium]|jgi:hypothetical protein|nr:hypothetical protein [Clostridiales bacterium]
MTQEQYKQLATAYREETEALLLKPNRSEEDNFDMIHKGHASCCFWTVCGTSLHIARGECLLSRVYAALKMPQSCLMHAERALRLSKAGMCRDHDMADAYECAARGYYLSGDGEAFATHQLLAIEYAQRIADPDDRAKALSAIAGIDEE